MFRESSLANHFHKKTIATVFSILSIIGYGVFVFAAGPFAPGTELDPACSPYINNDPLQGVDLDCVVTAGSGGSRWSLVGGTGPDIYFDGGNVGVGNNNPLHTFDVGQTTRNTSPLSFSGTLNDLTVTNNFFGPQDTEYYISIDATGNPDTVYWEDSSGGEGSFEISGTHQLSYGVSVSFQNITGHAGDEQWTFTVSRNSTGIINAANSIYIADALVLTPSELYLSGNFFAGQYGNDEKGRGSIFIGSGTPYNPNFYNSASVFIGGNAGFETQGNVYSSVFIGSEAGSRAYSASNSIFIGKLAGENAEFAPYSTFIGQYSGKDATYASSSNFLGDGAGQNATSASYANFFGSVAGAGATNANNSNFLGLEAGYNATAANNSNFIGRSAGNLATNASRSNFLGLEAGYNATAANNSNFFGTNAGDSATSANNSNFFGLQAGNGATSANSSNFLGTAAGRNATSAFNSNFLGTNAGLGASSANNSNFFGLNAGTNAASAANSAFIGQQAGRYNSANGLGTPNAANSIFIGRDAAYTSADFGLNNTTDPDDFSILLGNYTSTGGFENSIALGQRATNTASNQFMIGSSTRRIEEMVFNGGSGNTCSIVAGTGISCSSDERLKTNITDLDDTTLDKLLNIQTVTYNWKEGINQNTQIGFIAQNINEYFPELVSVNNDGMFAVNYAGMTPILTKAIQELDLKISNIESFASSIDTTFVDAIKDWLASATNSITLIVSDTLKARNQLCIDDVCITKDQLAEMMSNQGMITPEIVVDPVIENVDELEIVPEGEPTLEIVPEPEAQPQLEPVPETTPEPMAPPETVTE